jgi:hypothetical protein
MARVLSQIGELEGIKGESRMGRKYLAPSPDCSVSHVFCLLLTVLILLLENRPLRSSHTLYSISQP